MSQRLFPSRQRGGFTLVELIVVIGIIVLLAGIALPALINVLSTGRKTAIQGALLSVEQALTAYESDFGDIPRFGNDPADPLNVAPDRGARLLARALMGVAPENDEIAAGRPGLDVPTTSQFYLFQDGIGKTTANPFGFRTKRVNYNNSGILAPADPLSSNDGYDGETYEPYLSPDEFQVRRDADGNVQPNAVILNPQGQPIFYYPRNRVNADVSEPNFYVGSVAQSRYRWFDNQSTDYIRDEAAPPLIFPTLGQFAQLLGDSDGNGSIDQAGEQAIDVPYILITPGPSDFFMTAGDDEVFDLGVPTDTSNDDNVPADDLISNVDLVLPQ